MLQFPGSFMPAKPAASKASGAFEAVSKNPKIFFDAYSTYTSSIATNFLVQIVSETAQHIY
jgi:hypothetical protein